MTVYLPITTGLRLPRRPRRVRPARELPPPDAPPMLERAFFERLRPLLVHGGWRWIHHYDSRRSNWGFPDLFAIRGTERIYAELKGNPSGKPGVLSDDQRGWLDHLAAQGERCYAWWPWHEDEARLILQPAAESVRAGDLPEFLPRWPYGEV